MKDIYNSLPLLTETEILVVGAGPSGICAAVAAARSGKRVVLAERFGTVGGNLTLGHITTCMGEVESGTVCDEAWDLLETYGKCIPHNIDNAKYKLLKWLDEAGVAVLLQTPCVEAVMKEDRICGAVVSTQQGLRRISAEVVIDATGDGMIAALAGAQFKYGREADGLVQPASILFTIGGVESELCCTHEADDTKLGDTTFLTLCKRAHDRGELPKNVSVVRLYGSDDKSKRLVNATQLCKANGLEPFDVAKNDLELRRQTAQIVSFLKKEVDGFENIYVIDSADLTGYRETRRICGRYVLRAEDILNGRRFEDAVVKRVNFCLDIHNPDGCGQAEDLKLAASTKPYDIPYGCLLPMGVEGLLLTGRCISGTHRAHSSYRVMNICMALGQAAGVAAAMAIDNKVLPSELSGNEIYKCIHS